MNRPERRPLLEFLALVVALIGVLSPSPSQAISVELKDVAADRIERQRQAAQGALPLPNTPEVSRLNERLGAAGLTSGAPVFVRIFKAESQLELWMRKGDAYVLFATYPVCHWSGTLGPKLYEGDKQSPEGFYSVSRRQLHRLGRWRRALNLGFPNALDKSEARTGSYILVHGGCSSVGCFAMTNAVIEEIYGLVEAALKQGQSHVPVHVFPFRMTDANLARYADSAWRDFWQNLREGYDAFERTRRPPRVSVCDKRYLFADATPEEAGDPGPLAVCGETAAVIAILEPLSRAALPRQTISTPLQSEPMQEAIKSLAAEFARHPGITPTAATQRAEELVQRLVTRPASPGPLPRPAVTAQTQTQHSCSLARASCRKWIAMQERKAAFARATAQKPHRTAARGR